jgi:hypothetical protein
MRRLRVSFAGMSYQTLEVELEDGRGRPAGAEQLPVRATALLTILNTSPAAAAKPARSLAQALRELNVQGRGEFTDLSTNKRHLDDLGN